MSCGTAYSNSGAPFSSSRRTLDARYRPKCKISTMLIPLNSKRRSGEIGRNPHLRRAASRRPRRYCVASLSTAGACRSSSRCSRLRMAFIVSVLGSSQLQPRTSIPFAEPPFQGRPPRQRRRPIQVPTHSLAGSPAAWSSAMVCRRSRSCRDKLRSARLLICSSELGWGWGWN